jgi:hypothetical protein
MQLRPTENVGELEGRESLDTILAPSSDLTKMGKFGQKESQG